MFFLTAAKENSNVINKKKVIFSVEKTIKKTSTSNVLGSISFVPSVAGLIIASEVIKDTLNLN